jgi:hypothetical protein
MRWRKGCIGWQMAADKETCIVECGAAAKVYAARGTAHLDNLESVSKNAQRPIVLPSWSIQHQAESIKTCSCPIRPRWIYSLHTDVFAGLDISTGFGIFEVES